MSKAFSNLLKHIGNLSHTEKEQVFQWVKRYVEPSSSVGGRLINEMRETRFKEGFECPHCASEHVVRFGKHNIYNAIVVNVVVRHSLIQRILFFTVLEKETNGLHLLIVCLKDIPCESPLKSWGLHGLHFFIGDINC
ncbi:hypothetical protein IK1_04153 [Bacillus cereus VD146]|uniref:Transposase zinc-ribbon domain-containing protein n=1 Tax=Bacillus cereus (strain VD146) TaxID=1053236 RepID=R8NIG9_BACCX|nr:hypothetical protein IK1_04153 [Bacillus cereus VD146]